LISIAIESDLFYGLQITLDSIPNSCEAPINEDINHSI